MRIVLAGEPGCGKTTVCERLLPLLREKGIRCGGILCLEAGSDGRRLGKVAVNVATGEKKLVAAVDDGSGRYSIIPAGVEFGKMAIGDAGDCDVVFVDEIGPLELSGGGLMEAAKEAMGSKENVVVVVRIKLLEAFLERFGGRDFKVFDVDERNRDGLPEKIMECIGDAS